MNGTHRETLSDVSKTLLDLLVNEVQVTVAVTSPNHAGTNRLTLFLYKVVENPDLKNAQRLTVQQADGSVLQRPAPLSLDAYYLLTAHSNDPGSALEAHRVLGHAMQVLHDNGVLQGSRLRAKVPSAGLTERSVLRISLNPMSMEDMTRIWSVFPDTPYKISVSYLVTPVEIDSAREVTGAPVVDQVHEQGHRNAAPTAVGG